MIIIVMGVTGCGKTTLGRALAERLKLPFYDADDFHPDANREKLRANIPLGDEDRMPWLQGLSQQLEIWERSGGAVLACSALKERYRAILSSRLSQTIFVYLHGDRSVVAQRLQTRSTHDLIGVFDKILDGQYRDLEEPVNSIEVPVSWQVADSVDYVVRELARLAPG